MQPADVSE